MRSCFINNESWRSYLFLSYLLGIVKQNVLRMVFLGMLLINIICYHSFIYLFIYTVNTQFSFISCKFFTNKLNYLSKLSIYPLSAAEQLSILFCIESLFRLLYTYDYEHATFKIRKRTLYVFIYQAQFLNS